MTGVAPLKKVTAKHFYSFDSDTLIKAFNDPSVVEAKLLDSGAKDVTVDLTQTEAGFTVSIERTMPADVPSVLKAVLGEWNIVKQTETWTGSPEQGYECALNIEIDGVPVKITGNMTITSSGILTTNHVEIEISSSIPLMGGQMEKFVASSIEKSIAQEFTFLKQYLS